MFPFFRGKGSDALGDKLDNLKRLGQVHHGWPSLRQLTAWLPPHGHLPLGLSPPGRWPPCVASVPGRGSSVVSVLGRGGSGCELCRLEVSSLGTAELG